MNGYIIGGLFAIALLAFIALAFTLRGETRAAEPEENAPTASSNALPQAGAEQPARPQSQPLPEAPTLPLAKGTTPQASEEEHQTPLSDGQFRELAAELHLVRQQARELDFRLSALTDMIERVERSHDGRSNTIQRTRPLPQSES